VAVVGAGDFIGGEIAKKFAFEGFTVFIGRRQEEKLTLCLSEIKFAHTDDEVRQEMA
jgi:short-subunit dehydrogenase